MTPEEEMPTGEMPAEEVEQREELPQPSAEDMATVQEPGEVMPGPAEESGQQGDEMPGVEM